MRSAGAAPERRALPHARDRRHARGLMGLVMEYVEGTTRTRSSRASRAATIAASRSRWNRHLHRGGPRRSTVHCNVKPSNIMLAGGTHKLLNFGLSSSLGEAEEEPEEPKARDLDLAKVSPESIGREGLAPAARGGDAARRDPRLPRPGVPRDHRAARPRGEQSLRARSDALRVPRGGRARGRHREEGRRGERRVSRGAPRRRAARAVSELAPSARRARQARRRARRAEPREARPQSAQAVCRALERVRSPRRPRARAPAGGPRALPGPGPLEASDRDVFFGRSAEAVAAVLELARSRRVGVVGLSGSGKSSLTRAGVVPAIEDGALGAWAAAVAQRRRHPGQTDLWAALERPRRGPRRATRAAPRRGRPAARGRRRREGRRARRPRRPARGGRPEARRGRVRGPPPRAGAAVAPRRGPRRAPRGGGRAPRSPRRGARRRPSSPARCPAGCGSSGPSAKARGRRP